MNKENTKLIARGISKKTIEDIVKIVKKNINLNENDLPIDPRIILDRLSTYYDDFEYIILQNNDPIFLYQEEGKLSVINGKGVIYFKSKTINSCNKGTYRSNFTIMHEIGH
jgi:Zn-dependent peptidase ImmA (M78 family)